MATSTLAVLRDQVRLNAEIRANPDFPDLRLTKILNLAQRYVQAQLNGLGLKKWETSQLVTAGLVAAAYKSASNNVKTIDIGATYFVNMIESPKSIIEIHVNDASSYGIAREIDVNAFEEQIANSQLTPTVAKPSFIRFAGKVWLSPTSITAATAYYYKVITDLAADGDSTEIPLEFEEYIVKKAVLDIQDILGTIGDKELRVQAINQQLTNDHNNFYGKMAALSTNKKAEKAKLQ